MYAYHTSCILDCNEHIYRYIAYLIGKYELLLLLCQVGIGIEQANSIGCAIIF